MEGNNKDVVEMIEKLICENNVMIFSATYCHFCVQVKDLFKKLGVEFCTLEVDEHENNEAIKEELYNKTNMRTVPNVFISGHHIGGCDKTIQCYHNGTLFNYLEGNPNAKFDYDLIVVGGGSGGISAASEASKYGKRVAIFDFVKPSPQGTTWGLGGTCVNVGCIPKKLMHHSALMGEMLEDCKAFGWDIDFSKKEDHEWRLMVRNIHSYIKKLNFNYKKLFIKNHVSYFNEFVEFTDPHTIQGTDKKGNVRKYTAQIFILACGGRPRVPAFPGCKLAITSDDLFTLPQRPGKTLIIGASYIALECAGFLNRFGIDCTVAVRSILLRGFDQQIANMIGSHMKKQGVKFLIGYVPIEIVPGKWDDVDESLTYQVTLVNMSDDGEQKIDYYNTVMMAVGRDPCVTGIGLENLGVKINESNQKIIVDDFDRTTCKTIYAIGDVQNNNFALTPVAIKTGKLLARRMFKKGPRMDYEFVPTTVFTPLEYGSCGYSEEEAKNKFGEANIESYHSHFQPLEWAMQEKDIDRCYAKLVCLRNEKMRVIGFHVLGPNAGEITQGFALALKLKATKADFDDVVSIHPTCAEVFTTLKYTRSVQPDPPPTAAGC